MFFESKGHVGDRDVDANALAEKISLEGAVSRISSSAAKGRDSHEHVY